MGIRAAGDPGSWRRLQTGGDGSEGDLRAGVVRGTGRRRFVETVHPPDSQTGGIGPSRPLPEGP